MEIEFKYKIDAPEIADKIFSDPYIVEITDENSDETIELHALYFDTNERRLSREGMTFRTRKEGSNYVATIKWNGASENGLHEREEINVPISEVSSFEMPDINLFAQSPMCEKLKNVIGHRELVKRVEVKVNRRQIRVDTGKSICEMSYDYGVVINGDKEATISEMEVELYSGSREDMERFGEELAEKFSLEPENRSKFKQGLELQG